MGQKPVVALGLVLAACGTFLDVSGGADDKPAAVATPDAGTAPSTTPEDAAPLADGGPVITENLDECAGLGVGARCSAGVCLSGPTCSERVKDGAPCEASWQCSETSVCQPLEGEAFGRCSPAFSVTCLGPAPGKFDDSLVGSGFTPLDAGDCGCCLGLACGRRRGQGTSMVTGCHQCGVTDMSCAPVGFKAVGCCPGYECSTKTQTCVRIDELKP